MGMARRARRGGDGEDSEKPQAMFLQEPVSTFFLRRTLPRLDCQVAKTFRRPTQTYSGITQKARADKATDEVRVSEEHKGVFFLSDAMFQHARPACDFEFNP